MKELQIVLTAKFQYKRKAIRCERRLKAYLQWQLEEFMVHLDQAENEAIIKQALGVDGE
jgi:predicted GIY-YIG superfamily endonuclease